MPGLLFCLGVLCTEAGKYPDVVVPVLIYLAFNRLRLFSRCKRLLKISLHSTRGTMCECNQLYTDTPTLKRFEKQSLIP